MTSPDKVSSLMIESALPTATVVGLAALYLAGAARLRARGGSLTVRRLACYFAGLGAIVAAVLPPLDRLADGLLTAHMVQHELLMMFGPPLILLGNPFPIGLWALPPHWRRIVGRLLARGAPLRGMLRALTRAPAAWTLSAVIFWTWHLPVAYDAALDHHAVHAFEHLAFVAAGFLFWWPVVDPAPRLGRRPGYPLRIFYLLTSGVVGFLPAFAIAGFARGLLYAHYARASTLFGLAPLDDQSFGWGVMGAIHAIVNGVAVLFVFHAMAVDEDRRLVAEAARAPRAVARAA